MSLLNYRSRGEATPDKKPKVFFCSHPTDICLLGHISSTILECSDCSVWYIDTNPTTEEETIDLLSVLSEMNLIVAPMTNTFFAEDSFAKNQIIPHILNRHVPFLPLMQSDNLDKEFYEFYGNIQYLYEFDSSPAALPFSVKLTNYLHQTLRTKQTDNLPDAFRAHVFLSYRKKDRKYVRDLMEKIHHHSGLDDIAFWYDEFLTPGENFSDSIAEEIEKADAFLMVITPNLTKEVNYVETDEYPYAKAKQKAILPCSIKETDYSILEKRYDRLPKTINLDELSHTLLEMFSDRKSSMGSPIKEYYLGFSYLLGINVEINREYGITLIEKSAMAGYKDAIFFMHNAYRYGLGVQQDGNQSIAWLKQYIRACDNTLIKCKDGDIVCDLISKQTDLVSLYLEVGNYDKVIEALNEAFAYVSKYNVHISDYSQYIFQTELLLKKAIVYFKLSKYTECMNTCERGIIQCEKALTKYQDSYEVYQLLNRFYCKKGETLYNKLQYYSKLHRSKYLQNAHNCYKNCFDISLHVLNLFKDGKIKANLSGGLSGRVTGDSRISDMFDEDYLSYICRKDYAIAATKVGDTLLESYDLSGASEYYCIAEREFNHINDIGLGTFVIKREIGLIHRKKSDVLCEKNEFSEALQEINIACKIGKELLESVHIVLYQQDLATYYYQAGEICEVNNCNGDALEYYMQSYDILQKLYETPAIVQFKKLVNNSIIKCKGNK